MLLGAGLLALATSCASRRVLVLENRLLEDENTELHRRLREGCASSEDYAAEVDLAVLHGFMERAGFAHTWTAGAKRISMDFRGRNTSFRVTVQHFDEAGVVFLATRDYLRRMREVDATGGGG